MIFYKYWYKFRKSLLYVYNELLFTRKIYTLEERKIVLLYKWRNNKDPLNYHHITYITINMKIFISNITNKIKSINKQTTLLI